MLPRSSPRRVAAFALLVPLLALGPASCGGSGSNWLRVQSDAALLEPTIQTAVYRFSDENTADLYLSDLPEDVLLARLRAGPAGPPASVVHIHMFLYPKAGRTPIDFTASNVSINYVVLTGSAVGVYGGGGFLLPGAYLGESELTGEIQSATLRLTHAQPGFEDRLGLPELYSEVSARMDDQLASDISSELVFLMPR
ncbi:MAG: hypothetical protein SFZ24_03685 [Planctomycetota bacterium]|nr:hypothetical protein [Planctomycetota bacterium]